MKIKLAYLFFSLVIIVFIGLQSIAVFGRVYAFFWPFVNYAMYSEPHYEGEKIKVRRHLIGILKNSSEVEILPTDLGITFWQLQNDLSNIIRREEFTRLEPYVQHYESQTGKHLIGLRLEDHPIVVTREGIQPAPFETLKTLKLPLSGRE